MLHYFHFESPKMNEHINNIQKQQKPRRPIPGIYSNSFFAILFATLFLLIISKCSATISNSNSSHQSTGPDKQLHQNAQNGIQSSHSAGHNARFHSFGEQQNGEKNLFREYLSRGMFTCAEKYVSILVKLNKLIASAHQEYSQCQGQIAATAGQSAKESRKLAEQLEMINELFGDEQ